MKTEIIEKMESFVKNQSDDLIWKHTLEVRMLGLNLSLKEKANREIVDVASIFHDVCKKISDLDQHALYGAIMAKKFLIVNGIDDDFIRAVYHCILTHSSPWISKPPYNQDVLQPQTIEAKVLFDADMLAQMTPLGIIKALFAFKHGPFNDCITHAFEDIKDSAYHNLLTESGKRIGEKKFEYVKEFFKDII